MIKNKEKLESHQGHAKSQRMGPGVAPQRKQQKGEEVKPTEITGTYVAIPTKYQDPKKTPLTYTVTSGKQPYDIELTE